MAAQPEAPETINYTRYVLDIGHSGDALDLLVGADALRGGLRGNRSRPAARSGHPTDDNPYASWIRNYGDEGYLHGVSAAGLLESVWQQRGGESRIAELSASSPPPPVWKPVLADGPERRGGAR
jgi:thiaminase/transcriptional activator TenA